MGEEKKLVVLDNGLKFVLIKEFNEPEGKYFFAAGITEDEEDLNGKFCYFKELVSDGEKHLEEVLDQEIISKLKIEATDFE